MNSDDVVNWHKSSFSAGQDSCVEVGSTGEGVFVRDTKDRSIAPHAFTFAEWDAFVAGVKLGEFDL